MVVMNSLRTPGAGFATDTNEITIFTRDGKSIPYQLKSKQEVANDILDAVIDSIG